MRRITALAALSILTIPLLSACAFVPVGPPVTQDRPIDDVSAVSLDAWGDLVITRGEPALTITASSGVIDTLTAEITDGVLHLGAKPGFRVPRGDVHYELTLPAIESVTIDGSGDVDVDFAGAGSVEIVIEGSGSIDASTIDADLVTVSVDGSGEVDLEGTTARFETSIQGSGDIDADDLEARDVVASIDGTGDMRLVATTTLDARISGAGSIRYSGEATVESEIDGVGEIVAN